MQRSTESKIFIPIYIFILCWRNRYHSTRLLNTHTHTHVLS